MKKLLIILVVIVAGYSLLHQSDIEDANNVNSSSINSDILLQQAYQNKKSNIQVEGTGTVIKLLPDDLKGSKHQKFILKLTSNQTLMIAHNIDLAPRVAQLHVGDIVSFYGEYEWNSQGGVIHWTHDDPKRKHINGWLIHKGRTYK